MPIHYYILCDGVQIGPEYENGADALAALARCRQEGSHTYEIGEIIVDISLADDSDDEASA